MRTIILFAAVTISLSVSGCAWGRRASELADAVRVRKGEAHDLSRIRNDTRDQLADQREEARRVQAQREVDQARLAAEKALLEMQLCRANMEAEQRALRSNIRDNVESKVAFNVTQGLEVGELEVDVEQLKKLMEDREKGPPDKPLLPPQECSCCDRTCGCGTGMTRRQCHICRHKRCEAENDCGGPRALRELAELPERPLRPAEIPMKLPVRLTFGMQNPIIEETKITQRPLVEKPHKERCSCGKPQSCTCAAGQAAGMVGQNLEGMAGPIPPVPQVDRVEPQEVASRRKIGDLFGPPSPSILVDEGASETIPGGTETKQP